MGRLEEVKREEADGTILSQTQCRLVLRLVLSQNALAFGFRRPAVRRILPRGNALKERPRLYPITE